MKIPVLVLAALTAAASTAWAQQRDPHIGYAYPAGGPKGAAFEITVGGQYLDGVDRIEISGKGIRAEVGEHKKPLTPKEFGELAAKLKELRDRKQEAIRKGMEDGRGSGLESFKSLAKTLGLEEMDVMAFMEFRKNLLDPKRQPNPQIAETVTVRVTVDPDAEPGLRELRLKTPAGFTNPVFVHVGLIPECSEKEPNEKAADAVPVESLPAVLNGQIMPGDVDRFRFRARKGTRLVADVRARELVPYLADAVPGWFKVALSLFDAKGDEIAVQDDSLFRPDPVLFCEIPADGEYVLEVRDTVYRGREDFVYRIALGELPFVTGVFPLGGRAGERTAVEVRGWNLPAKKLTVEAGDKGSGTIPVSMSRNGTASNSVPFDLDTLPECLEKEPNDDAAAAQPVELPTIVNGRIDRPGDLDVFSFKGRAGEEVVAEILARRLESPLDSLLRLTDAGGQTLAINDDHEDRGAGWTTHHADSRLILKLPADGTYQVHVGDTQRQGGAEFGYRLRLGPPRPDFELRVVPSRINARTGMTVPVSVYALRKDGFSGEIALEPKGMPQGFILSGGRIPAGQDAVRITLTAPPVPLREPVALGLEGRATVGGKEVRRTAVPAEDMMQAFIYHHLLPMEDWKASVGGFRRFGPPVRLLETGTVKLRPGAEAQVRFALPPGPLLNQIRVELSEPPEGITLEKVTPGPGGLSLLLGVDGEKAKPGLKGNLIVDAFLELAPRSEDGKARPARRIPIGALPAVPFEVAAKP